MSKDARALRLATARPLEHDDEVADDDRELIAAVESAPDPVALVAADGALVRWNSAWHQELGLPAGALAVASLSDLFHADDCAALEAAVDAVAGRRSEGEVVEARVRTGDGLHRWHEWVVRPHASRACAYLWGRDVEHRIHEERRFRAIVEQARDVLCVVSPEGRITYANRGASDLEGAVHELPGKHTAEDSVVQLRVRRPDGSWADMEATTADCRDVVDLEGFVVVARDVSARRRAEAAIRERAALLERLVTAAPVGLFELDADGLFVDANPRFTDLTGCTLDRARGRHWDELTGEDGQAALRRALRAWYSGEATATFVLPQGDGDGVAVRLRLTARRAPDGSLEGYLGSLEPASDSADAARVADPLQAVIEATPDVVLVWDEAGRVHFTNRAARGLLGVDAGDEELSVDRVYPAWARQRITELMPELRRRGAWSGELAVLDAQGLEIPVSQVLVLHEDGDGGQHVSAIARDISEHKAREAELAHRATHDALTGLPNRVLFLERLRAALHRGRSGVTAGSCSVAVIFLDLDRFKLINDSLGHDVGDQLLQELARRLQALLRPADLVARLGGDEFVVLCEGVEGERDALRLSERILEAVSEPFDLASGPVYVSTSIGVAVGSDLTPESLMENADVAMYRAKDRGRARCELFDAELRTSAVARLELETALRQAVERDELRVFYQPVFSLRTGGLSAVEALVRWQHPVQGLVGPAEFIPVAEESGLILPIGAWVLEEACRQARRWEAEHPESAALGIHVNLSARQFAQPDLAQQVARAIDAAGVDPARLCLEITESVVMDDVEATITALLELRALGVKVGIDDFGTGYSSLSYLKRLPVDVLKIDKSFVAKLGEDMVDSAIVSSVVNLARSLGIAVVAEGVETEQQRLELRALGCPVAQGYYFSRPLAADATTDLIASETWE